MKNRQHYVGASEVGAIMGVDKFRTIQDVFINKVMGPQEDLSDNIDIKRGNLYERLVIEQFLKENENTYAPVESSTQREYSHHKSTYLKCHVDYEIKRRKGGAIGILEVKCPRVRIFNQLQEKGIKEPYIYQIQTQLLLSGYSFAVFCAFNHETTELIHFEVQPDKEIQSKIMVAVDNFWNHNVLKKIYPELEPKPLKDSGNKAPPEVLKNFYQEYLEVNSELKMLTKKKQEIQDNLMSAMKEKKEYEFEGIGRIEKIVIPGRKSLDKKKFKFKHPEIDLEEFEVKGKDFYKLSERKSKQLIGGE